MTRADYLLSKLPEVIAIKAINNMSRQIGLGISYACDEMPKGEDHEGFLTMAFIWCEASEGQKYWSAVNAEYFKPSLLPVIMHGIDCTEN